MPSLILPCELRAFKKKNPGARGKLGDLFALREYRLAWGSGLNVQSLDRARSVVRIEERRLDPRDDALWLKIRTCLLKRKER